MQPIFTNVNVQSGRKERAVGVRARGEHGRGAGAGCVPRADRHERSDKGRSARTRTAPMRCCAPAPLPHADCARSAPATCVQ